MERDTFEVALSAALDFLPRDALVTALLYNSEMGDTINVCYSHDGCKRPPLIICLVCGEPQIIGGALGFLN